MLELNQFDKLKADTSFYRDKIDVQETRYQACKEDYNKAMKIIDFQEGLTDQVITNYDSAVQSNYRIKKQLYKTKKQRNYALGGGVLMLLLVVLSVL